MHSLACKMLFRCGGGTEIRRKNNAGRNFKQLGASFRQIETVGLSLQVVNFSERVYFEN